MMADAEADLTFQLGVTDLQDLAASRGCRYERTADGREELVIRPDGTVAIRAFCIPPNMRGVKRKDPSVWMISLRYHTYQGKPQDEGAIYLAFPDDVETIETLKFAKRDTPPKRAVRPAS